ncbi:MAG: 50S ribosomal protein L23 [Parcubacteria group bacterium GW2011_GWB1_43_8]|nr:MAG: 50S ribosomal protein L23 [Parcubacteria group bacterium GW2011_GWB1_43_8]
MVRQAVKKQYNVEPTKVRIINIPGKTVFIRRRQAQKSGYKKAIVYLKKGDKISL